MTRTIHCPKCRVELTIPEEAGSKRLRCPQCAERFYPNQQAADVEQKPAPAPKKKAQPTVPAPKQTAKVPPSSGAQASRPNGIESKPPSTLPDLRDMMDIPLLGDDLPIFTPKLGGVADVATLFGDDEPVNERRKKPAAEAKREARRCTSCGRTVPQGMSLCENCGLDQDTGQRYEVVAEELYDEAPPYGVEAGPPASVLVIGIVALAASGSLAILTVLYPQNWGSILLLLVCLFGIFSAIQFLRGKALKAMILSLMLAGGVDLVVMILLPIVMAEEEPIPGEPALDGVTIAKPLVEITGDLQVKPLTERIDSTKITLGVVFMILDAVMLISMTLPGVRQYFEKPQYTFDSEIPIT